MIEDQTLLVQGVLYAVHPVHLAGAVGNRIVVTLIDVDTVAAFVFGDIAGRVGGAKDLVRSDVADRHQPEAAADTELFVVPLEAQRRERLPHAFDDLCGGILRTAVEQYGEFVSPHPRQ